MLKLVRKTKTFLMLSLMALLLALPEFSEAKTHYVSEDRISGQRVSVSSWRPEVSMSVIPEEPNGDSGWYEKELPCVNLVSTLGKSLAGMEIYYDFNNQEGFEKWKRYQGGCIEPPEGEHLFRAVAVNIKNSQWKSLTIERRFKIREIDRNLEVRPEAGESLLTYNSKEVIRPSENKTESKEEDDASSEESLVEDEGGVPKEDIETDSKTISEEDEEESSVLVEKELKVELKGRIYTGEEYDSQVEQVMDKIEVKGQRGELEGIAKVDLDLSALAVSDFEQKREIAAKEITLPKEWIMLTDESLVIAEIVFREREVEGNCKLKLIGKLPLAEGLELSSEGIDQEVKELQMRGLAKDIDKIGDTLELDLGGLERIEKEEEFIFRIEDLIKEEKYLEKVEILGMIEKEKIFSAEVQKKEKEEEEKQDEDGDSLAS